MPAVAPDSAKTVRLQPTIMADQTLPYPYFVNEDGDIARQDFWKGKPARLVGLSKLPTTGSVDLDVEELFEDRQKAVGMYPVLADANDNWYTELNTIGSVS